MLVIFLLATVGLTLASRRRSQRLRSAAYSYGSLLWLAALGYCLVELMAARTGHSLVSGNAGLVISGLAIVVLPVALTPPPWRVWMAAFLGSFLGLLAFADLLYLRFFGSLVTLEASREAHQLWDLRSLIVDLTEPRDAWLLIVPLASLVLVWGQGGVNDRKEGVSGRRWGKPLLAYVGLLAVLLLAGTPMAKEIHESLKSRQGRSLTHVSKRMDSGFLNAHLIESSRSFRDSVARPPLAPQDRFKIEELHQLRSQEAQRAGSFGVVAGSNLLLIQVEALSTWVLGLEFAGKEVTPFLNSLADEAAFFPFVLDQTAEGRTSDAEYLVLNSQHPLPRGAVSYLHRKNRFVALPALLKNEGYTTVSAHAYKRGFWNRATLHPKYGFEQSFFERELGTGENLGWGLRDGVFFHRMVDELELLPEPYMAFLITLSMHPPYRVIPPSQHKLELGEWKGTDLGGYLELAHYFDSALRQFFDLLKARGLLENTVVALYGDHTAGGLSKQEVGAMVAGREGALPWPASFQFVPFFLRYPDSKGPEQERVGRVERIGGLLDLGPTLQHLLGVARPGSFLGRPMLEGVEGRAGSWKGKTALGEGLAYVHERCAEFPQKVRLQRVQCRNLRLPLEEERLLSNWVTVYDLAEELVDMASRPSLSETPGTP